MAANTVQTVTIPFDVIKLDANEQFKFMILYQVQEAIQITEPVQE